MGFWGGTVALAGPYANQYKIHFSQTRCLKYEDNSLEIFFMLSALSYCKTDKHS